jgi:hypothetical protein
MGIAQPPSAPPAPRVVRGTDHSLVGNADTTNDDAVARAEHVSHVNDPLFQLSKTSMPFVHDVWRIGISRGMIERSSSAWATVVIVVVVAHEPLDCLFRRVVIMKALPLRFAKRLRRPMTGVGVLP